MEIKTENDWSALSTKGLDVVVDPMVIRSADLFLRGARSAVSPEAEWGFISKNIHALGLFVDTIILEDRIPVFDYADTFDMSLNIGQSVFDRVNEHNVILQNVHVAYDIYMMVKNAALTELRKLYGGPALISGTLATEILTELAQAEYQWQPHLAELENVLTSGDEKMLARFFLGGLIFGGYAQLVGGKHVIQPKRSRLLIAAALQRPGAHRFEEELFAELRRRARASITDLPWRPTFFPYLLSIADTPAAVVSEALQLRSSSEVVEYRHWLGGALRQWKDHGRIDAQMKDVKAIAGAIDRRTGAVPSVPKLEVKVTVADVAALKPPGSVDFTPTLAALWGWALAQLPGKRYQKLLTRAVAADQAYAQFENRVSTVWKNA